MHVHESEREREQVDLLVKTTENVPYVQVHLATEY